MDKKIDWAACYRHLESIKTVFQHDLYTVVIKNFFPADSRIASLNQKCNLCPEKEGEPCGIEFRTDNLKVSDRDWMLYSGEMLYNEIIMRGESRKVGNEEHHYYLQFIDFRLTEYPPHFYFRLIRDIGGSREKREKLRKPLDEIAKQYELRHYLGHFSYDFAAVKEKGQWHVLKDKCEGFRHSIYSHIFMPYYNKFRVKKDDKKEDKKDDKLILS